MTSANGRPDIMLVSGEYFDYLEPENNYFNVFDIAHHLSNLCRYAGGVRSFFSVAQHSVLVSRLCPPEHAVCGLFHDMGEMAMVDIPSPLKKLLPEYKRIEERIERDMFGKLGIAYPMPPEVKQADIAARYIEQRDLMPRYDERYWSGTSEELLGKVREYPRLIPLPPEAARALFLAEYAKLTSGQCERSWKCELIPGHPGPCAWTKP